MKKLSKLVRNKDFQTIRSWIKESLGRQTLLLLSFFGWMFLAVFTFGIGLLWLAPYMSMTIVKFYEQLRAEFEGVGDEETPLQEEVTPAEEMQPAPEEEGKQATE